MVFVDQVGMSPTGEETVGVGGPFTIYRDHSLPTSASPTESYPSASCVCRADVTASMGSRPLTHTAEPDLRVPDCEMGGAEAKAALSTALSWWSVGTKGNPEATQTFSERWRRLTCCVTSGRVLSGPMEAHLWYTRSAGGVALSSRSALLAKNSGPSVRIPCHCRSRPSALTPTLEVAVRDALVTVQQPLGSPCPCSWTPGVNTSRGASLVHQGARESHKRWAGSPESSEGKLSPREGSRCPQTQFEVRASSGLEPGMHDDPHATFCGQD